ncbi:MAG: sensor histidine kinase [Aquabacterium sp.]|uniref:sensor histidine kinase n=1 Tax=Aquabacterium sp. TaxID=1872578 RepID=UPI003BE1D818
MKDRLTCKTLVLSTTDWYGCRGHVIAADEISDIFQKYHRGRGAQGKPGAGLGLSLVRRICELHQGSISVDSQEGVGSMFTLSIPRSQHLVT